VIARPERVVELTVAGVAGTGEPVKKAAKKLPAD
jgi:hypothetical protein